MPGYGDSDKYGSRRESKKGTLISKFRVKDEYIPVLENEGKEEEDRSKDVVYENREYRERVSRAATPPLQRQFEEPLQGFHVVRPNSFQPR